MLGSGTARVRVSASGGGSPEIASASDNSVKVASASGSKSAKISNASAGKSLVKSDKRRVAGLMKSAPAVKRVASRASSRKTYCGRFAAAARKVGGGCFKRVRQADAGAVQGHHPGILGQPLWGLCAQRELRQLTLAKNDGRPLGRPSAQTPGESPAFG